MLFTIENYLEAKRLGSRHAGRAASANTLKAYKHGLHRAEQLIGKPIASFTQEDGDTLMTLMDSYGEAHKNNVLSALRGMFAWGIGTKLFVGDNPVGGIVTTQVKRKIPMILTKAQINALFNAFPHERERLLFKLMYFGGLRIGEAVSLRVDHVTNVSIVVRGKGNKERRTRLPQVIMDELHSYMRSLSGEYVFGTDKPMDVCVFYDAFNEAKRNANLPQHLVPHNLRHTSATHMMQATHNIAVVQRFLGHNRPETTMIYAQIADDDLDEAHVSTFGH